MVFNDDHFMLNSQVAEKIYHEIKNLPIFDFHCHLDPKAIYENRIYRDIVELWITGDHYKWRLMRANGISEFYITGDATSKEKFKAWIQTVSKAYGNPLYHWSHLELKRIFSYDQPILEENWESLYELLTTYLQQHSITPRKLLELSNVKFVGTTDHPLDDLYWHQQITQDDTIGDLIVAPTFRPDEVFVNHTNFKAFIERLGQLSSVNISTFEELMQALENRIQFFVEKGCRASDISLAELSFKEVSDSELTAILIKRLEDDSLSELEEMKWQTGVLLALCRLYHQYGLVTQIHFGALRNNHSQYARQLGNDAGFDSMNDQSSIAIAMNEFIDALSQTNQLPKMIWYPLNPNHNITVANTLANFQANEEGIKTKLQLGAGWWFNDTKQGMIHQMNQFAEQGILANFIGMLTDSRSFMSFQRHEYFRRILSSYIGNWVETEEVPDTPQIYQMAKDIAFNNAKEFFN